MTFVIGHTRFDDTVTDYLRMVETRGGNDMMTATDAEIDGLVAAARAALADEKTNLRLKCMKDLAAALGPFGSEEPDASA